MENYTSAEIEFIVTEAARLALSHNRLISNYVHARLNLPCGSWLVDQRDPCATLGVYVADVGVRIG